MIVKPENFDTDYPRLSRKDNIDHKIFIFDDLTDLFLPDTPVKLDLFIFAFCLSGSGKVCINLHEHEVNKGNIIAIFPDDVLKGYSVNTEFKALFVGVTADAMEDIITDLHTVIPFIISFRNMPITTISETRLIDLAQFHSFLWHKYEMLRGNSPNGR